MTVLLFNRHLSFTTRTTVAHEWRAYERYTLFSILPLSFQTHPQQLKRQIQDGWRNWTVQILNSTTTCSVIIPFHFHMNRYTYSHSSITSAFLLLLFFLRTEPSIISSHSESSAVSATVHWPCSNYYRQTLITTVSLHPYDFTFSEMPKRLALLVIPQPRMLSPLE